MDSEDSDVRKYFQKWVCLSEVKSDPKKYLNTVPGTYLLRRLRGEKFGRLVGNSDILYIGSSNNIWQRIYENYILGRGGRTTKRIHKLLIEKNYLHKSEVAWCPNKNIEKELRKKYEEDHDELPPWNRAE